jgi:hypothetical protein
MSEHETTREQCPLPEGWVKSGLAHAEGARIFGRLLTDLTRDELIAVAAQGWHAERKAREELRGALGTLVRLQP